MKYSIALLVFFTTVSFASLQDDEQINPEFNNEGQLLIKKLHEKFRIDSFIATIGKKQQLSHLTIPALPFNEHGNPSEPSNELKQLRNGLLPYFIHGDFDCDKKQDTAIMLSHEKKDKKIYVLFATGILLEINDGGDFIESGLPGKNFANVIEDKASGLLEEYYDGNTTHKEYEVACNSIITGFWEKDVNNYVFDLNKKRFIRYANLC